MQSTGGVSRFLKPAIESSWEEDKSDLDTNQSTSFVYNPCLSLSLDQQRQKLPIFQNRNHIIYLLERYQTLILVGETGSGKSTQVPQYLLEAGWTQDGKIIGVTEPRRVAATALASRVAEEKASILGDLVGYSIRFDDCYDPHTTKIKYMTEGILIREMMADPLLRNYCVVMLDEVHERTLNTDIVMGLLKKIIKKNKRLKLIISSATVDANQLKQFFNFNKRGKEEDDTATIMTIEGRLYPVDIHYVKEPVPDYVRGVVDTVLKIHSTEPRGDVLAFLTGIEEVDNAVRLLSSQNSRGSGSDGLKLLVLPLHGSLPNAEQLKAFRSTPRGLRKVVVATNIAETSVTIPGILYVVDCGFVKLRWFNTACNADSLVIVPESRASANQRAGRAGRVQSGKVYRLFTEEAIEGGLLSEATPPEMQRSDLSAAVLQLKALGIHSVLRFDFPSPPPAANLLAALELCYALGAIDDSGQLTKPLGVTMAELPIAPMYAKALVISGEMGCSEEMLTIVSMLSVQSVFVRVVQGALAAKARAQHRKFEVAEGDLLTYLNVFEVAKRHGSREHWWRQHFINKRGVHRATQVRRSMSKLLEKFGIPLCSCNGDGEVVRRCLTAGFFPNAAYLHHSGVYRSVRGDLDLHIHPTSVLYTLEQPQWVVFCELVHTGKAYMRDVTVVEPKWLLELAPHFYEHTSISS
ncbi:probable ATP-dependent RNA helicase DHX35 [Ischnura elegans]|uniref:probable ATP-dependent RNA helicase DHX35 n=1 Tax=Ischnura elegans TaxID=197161 RepID=UPI001ED8A9EB|nr:probable ATP-dependent RNA helicase DHX35 [Ischnura elegans]